MLVLATGVLSVAQAADAPAPGAPASRVRLAAEPLLAGDVRPGEWAAVRVHLENDGPAIDGELRIASLEQSASSYGIEVQLATGARQDHLIYGKAGFFGSRFTISLVSGGTVVVTGTAKVTSLDPDTLGVYVIAERPDRLIEDLRSSIAGRRGQQSSVVPITPPDLPPRVEAWAPIDRLIWQDVPAAQLSTEQMDALATWVALGGDLVIAGGTTGVAMTDGFPDELLPYRPDAVVDVPLTDLAELLGTLPADATTVPALAGLLERGTPLGLSGGRTIAARMTYGQGSVSLIGIDPAASWLAGTALGTALWARVVPSDSSAVDNGNGGADGMLVDALSYLPSVEIPRMDHLFLLFLGYVILLGPVNYFVLRRLDRREWAWVTMPALVVVFTVAAFVLGIALKGTSVVVNELGVVVGAAGTDRGMADAYVGVFSPTRSTFDVRVAGGTLVSETTYDQQSGSGQTLDVLLGDPARIRDLQVAPGAIRAFHAQTAVQTPRIDTDLALAGDHLTGTITNASDGPIEHVSIAYGGGIQVLAGMAPGETREIDVAPGRPSTSPQAMARRLFGSTTAGQTGPAGISTARMAIIRSLWGGWGWDPGSTADPLASMGPVILAWRSGGIMDVDVGVEADHIGDTLYLLPIRVGASGPVSFTGGTVRRSVIEANAEGSGEDPSALYLNRGTMTVAYRPAGFEGSFAASGLTLRLAQGAGAPSAQGQDLVPLPDADQPAQEDPVATGTADPPGSDGLVLPRVQLFDRDARRWVEFAAMKPGQTYRVTDPARYVDEAGGFLVRFVSRSRDDASPFDLGVRLDGTVQ